MNTNPLTLKDIESFHRAVSAISKTETQRHAIFRAAGFVVDAEQTEEAICPSEGS
jgi:hypothetical protein